MSGPDDEKDASKSNEASILEHAPAALLWFDASTGQIHGANALFRALVGREDHPTAAEWIDQIVIAADMPQLLVFREQFAAGRTEPVPCELHLVRGANTFRALVELKPLDGAGAKCLIMFAQDAGSLRLAEQAREGVNAILGRVAGEWTETFDAVQMPVLLVDSDLRVRRLNRAAALAAGAQFREVIGISLDAVRACEPWTTAAELARATLSSGKAGQLEVRDAGNGSVWEITTSVAEAREDTARERLVVTARDVTATHELRHSLQRSEMLSALGSLVAGVAHEVRNPLFGISATLDALEVEYRSLAGLSDYLRVLRRDVKRLTQLMNELLDYGKPRELEPSRSSINDLLQEAIQLCEPLSQQRRVSIEFRPMPSIPPVVVDRERLVVVFKNLIENALHLSQNGSEVAVSATYLVDMNEVWVICSVADRGPGFPDEQLTRLFEPFFTRRAGGTGIGLALVHQIVTKHGGVVTARNRDGGGAIFEVRLPAMSREGR